MTAQPAELASIIPVQYRDAANYKARGSIKLRGGITASQLNDVRAALREGLYYVTAYQEVDSQLSPNLDHSLLCCSPGTCSRLTALTKSRK